MRGNLTAEETTERKIRKKTIEEEEDIVVFVFLGLMAYGLSK